MFTYEINPIGIVGTGVLDRPLIQQNLRTVREAGPYTHRVRLCKIKHPDKPEFVGIIKDAAKNFLVFCSIFIFYNLLNIFFELHKILDCWH